MVIEQSLEKTHRPINYLRLSVTDRCNLRCMYCMPEEGIHFIPHKDILTYEEMLHLVRISARCGIRKVRVTGGEPLARKGFIYFLQRLGDIETLNEITLTTNAVMLKEYAANIMDCGICRINISLDSLKPERFNVVAIKGVNDDEILDFARLTLEKPYHVRFIELMPVGEENMWSVDRFISTEEIFKRIQTLGPLKPILSNPLDGPAKRFVLDGGKGEIGFIGALSHHFCDSCNRLRLTADGHLRSCLFSDEEIDIKTPLREGKGDDYLMDMIARAIENKPENHGLIEASPRKCFRQMSTIGG